MTTAGDPAPTTVEPRTPTPYRAIGAGALIAATILAGYLIWLIGKTPHSPITTIVVLALTVSAGIQFGLWGLQQHRYSQRVKVTSAAGDARYTAWTEAEKVRHEAEVLQQKRAAKQDARLEAMAMRIDQLSSRLGWLIQQLAPERRSNNRPVPQQRQQLSSSDQGRGGRTRRKAPTPESLPDNVTQLPAQETLRAARRLAQNMIRNVEDNREDNRGM